MQEAAKEETTLALIRRSIANTDKAWVQHGETVGNILTAEARDSGFSLDQVGNAFQRLESGTQSTSVSLKLLGEAEDVARARHIGLAQAAGLLAKAQQGSEGAIRRLGIIIPPVTTEVDKLKQRHAELVREGVKFDETTKAQYKNALAAAAAADKQASSTRVLAEVQRRFRGESEEFARGPEGEFQRLTENISQFRASIGRDLLPVINQGVEDIREWVNELRESDRIHEVVSEGVHVFAAAVNTGKQAVEFFIPPLRTVAGILQSIGSVAGFGGILAFVGGFKAVAAAADLASSVQQRYRAVVDAGRASEAGRAAVLSREATAYNALTAATERNSLATRANLGSQAASATAIESKLLPELANVSQVVATVENTSRDASASIAQATSEIGSAGAEASGSLLETSDSVAALSDHSVALAKDLTVGRAAVRGIGTDLAIARTGAVTFADGLGTAAVAQLRQAGLTNQQVVSIERYLAVSAGSVSVQRQQALATEAQAAASAIHTTAVRAEVEALLALQAANLRAAEAAVADAAATTVAGAAKTATAATGLGASLSTLGRGLFTLAGGWTTVAAVGLGALAFGIYKGVTAENALERSTRRLDDTLDDLGSHLSRTRDLAHSYADSISNIKSDKVAVDTAKASLALARQALATTDARTGSVEYLQIVTQVAQAQDGLRRAEEQLAKERRDAASLAFKRRQEEDEVRRSIEKTIGRINELRQTAAQGKEGSASVEEIAALRKRRDITAEVAKQQLALNASLPEFVEALRKEASETDNAQLRTRLSMIAEFIDLTKQVPSQQTFKLLLESNAPEGLRQIINSVRQVQPSLANLTNALRNERFAIQESNPALARRTGLLLEFVRASGRTPTKKEFEIALKTPNLNDAIKGLQAHLSEMDKRAQQMGFASGKDFANNFIVALLGSGVINALNTLLTGALNAAGGAGTRLADVSAAQLSGARNDIKATNNTIKEVRQDIADARSALKDATRNLADANRDVADAIRDGAQQVRDSVTQAGSNLFQIGSSLSDAIDEFLDAAGKTDDALKGPAAREANQLRTALLSGEGGDDLARRAQEFASQVQQQQAVESKTNEDQKKRSRRQIADLVDQFNKGTISISTFNKRLAGILAADGVTYGAAGKRLGIAFADGFRAQLRGLREQAREIGKGPFLPGISPLGPSISRPAEVLRQTQREIADAQRRRDDARLEVQKAIRHVGQLEQSESRLILQKSTEQTKLQRLMEQHLRFMRQQSKRTADAVTKPGGLGPGPSGEGHTRPRPRRNALDGSRAGAGTH